MSTFIPDQPEDDYSGSGKKDSPEAGTDPPDSGDEINIRIAEAGRMVREEAKRLLAQETLIRRRLPAIKPGRFPKPLTAGLTEEEQANLIEVTDGFDRPLICIRPESAIRQSLSYRLVSVALCRGTGRLVLHKRQDSRLGHPGCWDIHTAFVLVGEAREDAVLRVLGQAGLDGIGVKPLRTAPPEGERRARISYFVAELPEGLYPLTLDSAKSNGAKTDEGSGGEPTVEIAEVLEVDADELAGIVRDVPELLSPELLWAARNGLFFGGAKPSRMD